MTGHSTRAIQLKQDDAMVYFNRGITYQKMNEVDLAIKDFTKVIQLNQVDADAYNRRGMAYGKKGEVERSIQDFNVAIALKPNFADPYINLGLMWLQIQAWDYFKSDLTAAKNVGVDIALGFRNAFGSVENFEKITGVRLPEDIIAMLISPQA